jgi:hypothetical protein
VDGHCEYSNGLPVPSNDEKILIGSKLTTSQEGPSFVISVRPLRESSIEEGAMRPADQLPSNGCVNRRQCV